MILVIMIVPSTACGQQDNIMQYGQRGKNSWQKPDSSGATLFFDGKKKQDSSKYVIFPVLVIGFVSFM